MKQIVLLLLVLTTGQVLYACDICGAGAGSSYMGILPQFNKRFIGLRQQFNGVKYHLGPGGTSTYLTTTEQFKITELWGATNIGKRFRLALFIPYNFIERNNQEGTSRTQGLGDITAIGYYQLINNQKTFRTKTLAQSLWIGGGVKAPTGKYNPEEKNIGQSSLNTFQSGTGSIDFSLNAMYDIRLHNAGININAGYKLNTPNKYDYRYGNKLTLNMLGYYRWVIHEKLTISPNTGVLYETATKDWKSNDIQVWETGGRSLMGAIGTEVNLGKFSIGANFQTPLAQDLGENKVRAKNRGMVHISFSF
jgi:hypothetical protein